MTISPADHKKAMQEAAGVKGVLLVNLGTPDSPEPGPVGRYLRQFLMDRWVIDIPWIFRWILVHLLIVPRRKYKTSEAYKKIWTSEGSPLLLHTRKLRDRVAHSMGSSYCVEYGMRYGNPSLQSALLRLQQANCTEIIVLPLYPQYAESSTRTAKEEIDRAALSLGLVTPIQFRRDFYEDPGFISAYADLIRTVWASEKPDHLLLSYHGLPERHIRTTDRSGGKHCLITKDCCNSICDSNRDCYRAQCYTTSRALVASLGLAPHDFSVSFQSRLGRTPWIQPFTDEMFDRLAKMGVKRLAVACPSFTSDCLETIEEIGIRGAADFKNAGGETLARVACLNSSDHWVDAVCTMLRTSTPSVVRSSK